MPGTIRVRAVQVSATDTCAEIRASTSGIDGTWHQFTPSSASTPAPPQQHGSAYVTFDNLLSGDYGVNPVAPPEYQKLDYCWIEAVSGQTGETMWATLPPGDTLTWDIGYTRGVAWSQTQGGDVYASGALKSYVPAPHPPQVFILDGTTGGYPGVATYGQTYDFDSDSTGKGEFWVSGKKWLVNDTASSILSPVLGYNFL
jgi:hypothetical protein